MKQMLIVLAVVMVTLSLAGEVGSAPIIIDHTCTDLSKIPLPWLEAAKTNLRISYRHSSHGSQLVTGIFGISDTMGAPYNFSYYAGATFEPGYFLTDGFPKGADDLGAPNWTQWAEDTRAFLQQSDNDRNVVMWSWCGQVSTATKANIDTYLSLMNQLEQDFPDVKFVYMTGHLDGTGATGNLNVRNEQIRKYCRDNNKILFDFADIESFDPDGERNFMKLCATDGCLYDGTGNCSPWSGSNWARQWINGNPGSEFAEIAAQCGECAHSENLNCVLKGTAFWWMTAMLAGWNGGLIPQYTLAVELQGTGHGTVAGQGLTCSDTTCMGTYEENTTLDVTATAHADSVFLGWTGCDAVNGAVCTVTMTSHKSITAVFDLNVSLQNLTVIKTGAGAGMVASIPPGISCGVSCATQASYGTDIILTASATCGSVFVSWSGGPCNGSSDNTCRVTMTGDVTVTALFDHDPNYTKQHKLRAVRIKLHKGKGSIFSEDGAIHCTSGQVGKVCRALYYEGCPVNLSAVAIYPNTFLRWKGGCTGISPTCTVDMSRGRTVLARFYGANMLKVTIVSKRHGKGTVTSVSPGPGTRINCGDDCKEFYKKGESVTLVAQESPGSTFSEWRGGGCTGSSNPECTISMGKAHEIKAVFTGL